MADDVKQQLRLASQLARAVLPELLVVDESTNVRWLLRALRMRART